MAKVLLAEDDEPVRYALGLALRMAGFDVVEIVTSQSLSIDEYLADVDVVVTDILMPKKDGIELITELQETKPELPIIAISGGGRISSEDYLLSAKALGARATFQKPLNEEQLIATINEFVAQ